MHRALSIALLTTVLAAPAAPSITDGADPVGIAVTAKDLSEGSRELVVTITDGADPIPPVAAIYALSITDGADPVGVKDVWIDHEGTSVVVRTVLGGAADKGTLILYVDFDGVGTIGIVVDLASITDDADPV